MHRAATESHASKLSTMTDLQLPLHSPHHNQPRLVDWSGIKSRLVWTSAYEIARTNNLG